VVGTHRSEYIDLKLNDKKKKASSTPYGQASLRKRRYNIINNALLVSTPYAL
jgi:hypothetical protein